MTGLRTSLIWNDEVMEDFVLQRPRERSKTFDVGLRVFLVFVVLCGASLVLQRNVEWYERLAFVGGSLILVLAVWPRRKEAPTSVSIGQSGDATFVVPDVGLPAGFTFVRPGNRGYLLTLGSKMRGKIVIDGEEKDIANWVRHGDSSGEFRATPISGKDWGLVELDDSGAYKVFFQFVPVDEPTHFFTPKMLGALSGGLTISTGIVSSLWSIKGNLPLDEAIFRGFGMSATAITLGILIVWLAYQNSDTQASLTFSVMLHAALLYMTYVVYNGINPFVYPGTPDLTGQYIKSRLDAKEPEPEKPKPTVGTVNTQSSAPKAEAKKPENTATKGQEGASGGQGDKDRAKSKTEGTPPPKVQFFEDKNRKYVEAVANSPVNLKNWGTAFGEERPGAAGHGHGTGTGVGDELGGTGTTRGSHGHGTGGGGNVEGDYVTNKGPIGTGTNRPGGTCVGAGCKGTGPKEVAVHMEEASGDFNGLTKEEIDRVVKSRSSLFKACYQKELNHTPGLGGKVVIHFVITADGVVKSSSTAGGGSLHNAGVEDCINNNVMRLKFPAKGGAIVNYPFVFSQGG